MSGPSCDSRAFTRFLDVYITRFNFLELLSIIFKFCFMGNHFNSYSYRFLGKWIVEFFLLDIWLVIKWGRWKNTMVFVIKRCIFYVILLTTLYLLLVITICHFINSWWETILNKTRHFFLNITINTWLTFKKI